MIVYGRTSILFLLLLHFFAYHVDGQDKAKKRKKRSAVEVIDTAKLIPLQEILAFSNVNVVPYYVDNKALDRIRKLEAAQNWEQLYLRLGNYIKHFGIQNFYKDTHLLWRFAKLTELYGDLEDAKTIYKLVLKHHRDDIALEKLEIYYDSISQNELNRYVPIDYYYELIDYRREIDTLRPPRGWKLNMGHLINSEYSDDGPSLSVEDNLLIFTSKRNIVPRGLDQGQNEDIYFSKYSYGSWEGARPLKSLNTVYNEGSVCLSANGTTMFFARCDAPDSYGNCDIYMASLQPDSTWGSIQNLGPGINSRAWDSHPSLSHNEDTLYFASDRIGGFGLSDIYYAVRDSKGRWQPARNAGPVVNTRGNDVSPFVHPAHHILYFSSNGHNLNFGEFDIYKSSFTRTRMGEPKNIGPLVNGPGSEFYFTIDSNSKNLYYARSIENDLNNLDLYSFPLPMEAQPLATTQLYGSLRDSITGNPFQRGIVSIIDLANGIEIAPQFLGPQGDFYFELINNNKYLLVVQGDEFFRIEEIFVLEGDMELNMFAESISSRIEFESIEFDEASSELKPSMYRDLDRLGNFLLDNPDFKLRISGHTDSDGSDAYNLQLSKDRARAIAEYIIYFGRIPEARIETFGFGSSKPIVEEITEEDKALNRRVEFELYRPSREELELMRREIREEADDDWN
jgi:outer membrane protein OmpA-like peptidoglycan-associated protein